MEKTDRIYIAGHNGLVGSALNRALINQGYENIITSSHRDLDLTNKVAVGQFFERTKPGYVFLAAAKVGGINANITYPVEFLLTNLEIQNNVIRACYQHSVKKLIFLGSSCVYPTHCKQPIKEEYLMSSGLEPTNEGYALAKIAGIRLAQYYHTQYGLDILLPMPCNLYGIGDSFDTENSHVLSATVKKFVDAVDENKTVVEMWGSGNARREFLNVDDAVRAVLLLNETWNSPEIINVGSGSDISIKGLTRLIANETGYTGNIAWDMTKPDGMLRKCLDVSKLKELGFEPDISLIEGIKMMIKEYRARKYTEDAL